MDRHGPNPSLGRFGCPDLWRSATWRAIKAAYREAEAAESATQSSVPDGSSTTVAASREC